MKKVLITGFLGLATFAFSQCNIQGKEVLKVKEEVTFNVDNEYAQCKDCHQWKVIGNATIVGDNRQNEVKVVSQELGNLVLNATVLTPNGVEVCTKNINVVQEKPQVLNNNQELVHKKVDCDILVSDFKEVNYGENKIAFFPNKKEDELFYTWQVNYIFGGDPKVSNEKVPVFENSPNNTIQEVILNITSKKCLKKYSKKYTPEYWKYFDKK